MGWYVVEDPGVEIVSLGSFPLVWGFGKGFLEVEVCWMKETLRRVAKCMCKVCKGAGVASLLEL